MTLQQYLRALKALDLYPTGKDTALLLGLSVRQLIRIANDQTPIPAPVARLVEMYRRHGIPKDWLA